MQTQTLFFEKIPVALDNPSAKTNQELFHVSDFMADGDDSAFCFRYKEC